MNIIFDRNTDRNINAIAGEAGENYQIIKGINNNLGVLSKPYQHDVVTGSVPGINPISKFGHNSAVGASLEEVWDGSTGYVYMTSASTLYISSSDTNDDQVYEVQGLDESWNVKKVNATANGFNFVAIDSRWIRVFRVKNIGTTDNAGTIYISDDNTDVGGDGVPDTITNAKAIITAGFNQTLMALWSVPANMTAYLTFFYAATSSSKATEVHLYVRPFGGVFQIKKVITIFEGAAIMPYEFPLEITAKSDIVIKASAVAGGGEVSGGFDLWYQDA